MDSVFLVEMQYVGLWYEIYRTNMVFQFGMKCVNATYTANADGTISMWNQAISGLGAYISSRAVARAKDPSNPAAMAIFYDNPSKISLG
jgi:lipocalin